jgi:hypothetical protein
VEKVSVLMTLDNLERQAIILSGPYLSDPQLIAIGYALEQALNGRVEPDRDATIAQIDVVTGK